MLVEGIYAARKFMSALFTCRSTSNCEIKRRAAMQAILGLHGGEIPGRSVKLMTRVVSANCRKWERKIDGVS